jgi:hypothetical protein
MASEICFPFAIEFNGVQLIQMFVREFDGLDPCLEHLAFHRHLVALGATPLIQPLLDFIFVLAPLPAAPQTHHYLQEYPSNTVLPYSSSTTDRKQAGDTLCCHWPWRA